MTIKKYITKDGVEVVKTYNQNIYNANYKLKHPEKQKETLHCEVCNKDVLISNKYNHRKTQKHIIMASAKTITL